MVTARDLSATRVNPTRWLWSMDPRVREDDGVWIPAYARMTTGALARMTGRARMTAGVSLIRHSRL